MAPAESATEAERLPDSHSSDRVKPRGNEVGNRRGGLTRGGSTRDKNEGEFGPNPRFPQSIKVSPTDSYPFSSSAAWAAASLAMGMRNGLQLT